MADDRTVTLGTALHELHLTILRQRVRVLLHLARRTDCPVCEQRLRAAYDALVSHEGRSR
jgi:hypothetical protein